MKKKNDKNNGKKKDVYLTDYEVVGLLSTIKNAGREGNAALQKKALDKFVKNGGISKLLKEYALK